MSNLERSRRDARLASTNDDDTLSERRLGLEGETHEMRLFIATVTPRSSARYPAIADAGRSSAQIERSTPEERRLGQLNDAAEDNVAILQSRFRGMDSAVGAEIDDRQRRLP
jgi:hypothetical protein